LSIPVSLKWRLRLRLRCSDVRRSSSTTVLTLTLTTHLILILHNIHHWLRIENVVKKKVPQKNVEIKASKVKNDS
jgi:hypothetical protein